MTGSIRGSQQVVTLRRAEAKDIISWSSWFRRCLSYPWMLKERLTSTISLIWNRELMGFLQKPIDYKEPYSTVETFLGRLHIVTDPKVMREVYSHPRKEEGKEAFFYDNQNPKSILPLLKELFPEDTISEDDFLITCRSDHVSKYRKPLVDFIGKMKMKDIQPKVKKIARETIKSWGKEAIKGSINATKLTHTYTTRVITEILLGQRLSSKKYSSLAHAVDAFNKQGIRNILHAFSTKEEKATYHEAQTLMRDLIQDTMRKNGPFVKVLRQGDFTDIQIKTMLFLLYFGGTESTSSWLNYLLWQIGQHRDIQQDIHETLQDDSKCTQTINRVKAEALRLFAPVFSPAREAAVDLILDISEDGNIISQKRISKGDIFLCIPTFAGQDSRAFSEPYEKLDEFDPKRYPTGDINDRYSWLPFGSGIHTCPGQWLARLEVEVLVKELFKYYSIQSEPNTFPGLEAYMTLKMKQDVFLALKKQSPSKPKS